MDIKISDLVSLFESSLKNISDHSLQEIGIVIKVGDGICYAHGLINVVLGELVTFEKGNRGIVMQLDDDAVAIFLLYEAQNVSEGEVVKRTGSEFTIPVSMAMLGRVINILGKPVDGLQDFAIEQVRSIESEIPGIVERSPINEALETGIMAIDALVPIGKGQRELIIGNRTTGKTSMVIDIILHQKGKNVLCVYVAIGQRQTNIARMIKILEENDALSYTTIVVAQASEAVLNHYLAPYVGCTIAEYYRDHAKDVLIIYDDLSNHAVAFREMSLLLRRAPGREAYPGDVFYLHSRLLERAGKLLSGGSITALPIVQIQSDDITAYIPTNLISITDGQLFLDTTLFNQGIRPAVNAELSVSRVGSAAQTKAIKKVTKALRLELAQYKELLDFAQFGTELDHISRQRLLRGSRTVELLKQQQYMTFSFVDQTLMLFLLKENMLDPLDINQVNLFARQFVRYVQSVYPNVYEAIEETKDLSDDIAKQLLQIAQEFSLIFVVKQEH